MYWKVIAAFVAAVAGAIAVYEVTRLPPPERPSIRLNHVGISVADMDQAIDFYTKKMGYRLAFAIPNAPGQPRAVYLQVNRETFVELLEATPQRPRKKSRKR